MATDTRLRFAPDYAVPPGETLLETIETLGMTQADLAARAGRPLKTINEIIRGKAAITPDTALQLERVLGVSATFWLNRESRYRETLARRAEQRALSGDIAWTRAFPIAQMVKLGWLPEVRSRVERTQALLQFLGVARPEQWEEISRSTVAQFRMTSARAASPAALHAWLRRGESEARHLACAPFDKERFRDALADARGLTREPPAVFQKQLVTRCANAGVAVVFVPEITGSRASGATRWLSPNRALIQLSLRYKTDDHLWFTFFHEAGHILLHARGSIFIETDGADPGDQEREANRFAEDMLVPRAAWSAFVTSLTPQRVSVDVVHAFAAAQGIAAGIVVGRLQHEGRLPRTHLNALKRRLTWA